MNKEQYENTLVLKSVIEDKIAKNEPPELLNKYFQPCGTYGCILGDTFLRLHPELPKFVVNDNGLPADDVSYYRFGEWINDSDLIFGFDTHKLFDVDDPYTKKGIWLFSSHNPCFPLSDRLEFVQEQINLYNNIIKQ